MCQPIFSGLLGCSQSQPGLDLHKYWTMSHAHWECTSLCLLCFPYKVVISLSVFTTHKPTVFAYWKKLGLSDISETKETGRCLGSLDLVSRKLWLAESRRWGPCPLYSTALTCHTGSVQQVLWIKRSATSTRWRDEHLRSRALSV
jgi:hypothetical protein